MILNEFMQYPIKSIRTTNLFNKIMVPAAWMNDLEIQNLT